ncbi:hypothetical protein [Photorhabdus akhurstii]|uniref:hypothetical protein n=1 Tax=Photorhabdus akhurstii TaxID=171438 RepID=UPI000D45D669|nr:hypothetical protein C6H69_07495 [Photorhabdus luminescens]
MSQLYFYCEKWSHFYRDSLDFLSEKDAYKRHLAGKPYSVLVGSSSAPSHVIEITKTKSVHVDFLDAQLKEYISYQFQPIKNGKLFLSMAVYREFAEKEGEGAGYLNVSHGETYLFKEDGKVTIMKEIFNPYSFKESTSIGAIDLSGNYDEFPEFGKYELLLRKER